VSDSKDEGLELRAEAEFKKQGTAAEDGMRAKAERRRGAPVGTKPHLVGFAGGLLGGLTAMPGAVPAIWCDLRGLAKEKQRGLVQPFILGMQVLAISIVLSSTAPRQGDLAKDFLVAAPALIAGTFVGLALFGRVEEQKFRAVVLWLLLFSGVLMMR
jgi:uncharacterized membrane protein YfcA